MATKIIKIFSMLGTFPNTLDKENSFAQISLSKIRGALGGVVGERSNVGVSPFPLFT